MPSLRRKKSTPGPKGVDFLAQAMSNFKLVAESESELRQNMKDDLSFSSSEQWPSQIKQDRVQDGRPCLTINRLPQFLKQVTNQQRASRPGIQINPVDSGADVQTAEALQGIIRCIERNSDADIAYSTACEFQVICGRGYWRVLTEYADEGSFEQEIVIERIPNPLLVYMDPATVKADASDARFCFIFEDIPKNEFIDLYGDEVYATFQSWGQSTDRTSDWMPEGRVRVAEYFYKEVVREKLIEIEMPSADDPEVMITQRFFEGQVIPKSRWPETWREVNSRETTRTIVKWAKITPYAILEGNKNLTAGRRWPGKYIPVIQLIGNEINNDGKIDLRGMVRDAKDPQRMYSFWASALTEIIALAPRAPYIGAEGQFRGHEGKWNAANRKNFAYLEYVPVTVSGQIAPPPQRQQFDPNITSVVTAFQLADNDLKAVMGLFDASLGAPGPEQSGKAILARQRQGELGNSNYMDNLGRAIRYTGKILIDLIPGVYSPVRVTRILGDDGESRNAVIHNGAPEKTIEEFKKMQDIVGIYDVSVGRYDVTATVGPSYASKRQEAVEAMLQLINSYPQAAPIIGDLLIKSMDWPGAGKIAARLRKMMDPNLLEDGDKPTVPPFFMQQFQQLKAAYEELAKEQEVEKVKTLSDESIKRMEIESRERIAAMQAQADLAQTLAKADADRALELVKAEMARVQEILNARLSPVSPIHEPQAQPPAPPPPVPQPVPMPVDPSVQPPALPPGEEGMLPSPPESAGPVE